MITDIRPHGLEHTAVISHVGAHPTTESIPVDVIEIYLGITERFTGGNFANPSDLERAMTLIGQIDRRSKQMAIG